MYRFVMFSGLSVRCLSLEINKALFTSVMDLNNIPCCDMSFATLRKGGSSYRINLLIFFFQTSPYSYLVFVLLNDLRMLSYISKHS